MKSATHTWMTAVASIMMLVVPTRLAAQEKATGNEPHHHRYKLVDLRTLGGPIDLVDCCDGTQPVLNNRGVAVGGADTPNPNPNQAISCPFCLRTPSSTWELHGSTANRKTWAHFQEDTTASRIQVTPREQS